MMSSNNNSSTDETQPESHTNNNNNINGEEIKNNMMSVTSDEMRLRRKSTYKIAHNNETNEEIKQLRAFINDLHAKEVDFQKKFAQMETELRNIKNQYADESTARLEAERTVCSLEDQLATAQRQLEATEKCFLEREEESSALKLDLDTRNEENKRLKDDLNLLHIKVKATHET